MVIEYNIKKPYILFFNNRNIKSKKGHVNFSFAPVFSHLTLTSENERETKCI